MALLNDQGDSMDDYAYINSRVRYLRSELLNHKIYEDLIEASGNSGIRDILNHTVYERCARKLPEDFSSDLLVESLKEEWLKAVHKIYHLTDGRPRTYLEVLLGRWELENIKTIFRGKKNHFGEQVILSALLPVGSFSPSSLAELVRQPTIEAIVDLLFTWRSPYARPLRKALKNQQGLQILEPLELSLDSFYFEEAFSKLDKGDPNASLLCHLMEIMVDKSNLLTAFKIFNEKQGVPLEPSLYFIQGGKDIAFPVYHKIAGAESLKDIREAIQKTPFAGLIEDVEKEKKGLSISLILERNVDRLILNRVRRMEMSDPLGIGLLAGYFLRKYQEMTNLRVIIQTKGYGMYPSDIRTLLVM